MGHRRRLQIYSECCSGLNPDVGHACFGKMLKDGVSNKSKEISWDNKYLQWSKSRGNFHYQVQSHNVQIYFTVCWWMKALVFVKVISGFLFSCWLYSHLGNDYSDCGILSVVTNYTFKAKVKKLNVMFLFELKCSMRRVNY